MVAEGERKAAPLGRRAILGGVALALLLVATCAGVTRLVGYDASGIPTRPLRAEDLLAMPPAGSLVYPASSGVERSGSDEVDSAGAHRAAELRTSGSTVVTPDVVLDFYRRSLKGWSVVDSTAVSLEMRKGREDFRVEVAPAGSGTAWVTTFAVAPGPCGTRLAC